VGKARPSNTEPCVRAAITNAPQSCFGTTPSHAARSPVATSASCTANAPFSSRAVCVSSFTPCTDSIASAITSAGPSVQCTCAPRCARESYAVVPVRNAKYEACAVVLYAGSCFDADPIDADTPNPSPAKAPRPKGRTKTRPMTSLSSPYASALKTSGFTPSAVPCITPMFAERRPPKGSATICAPISRTGVKTPGCARSTNQRLRAERSRSMLSGTLSLPNLNRSQSVIFASTYAS